MPKKKAKAAVKAAAATRCEEGGNEIVPNGPIRVRVADVVTLVVFICRSAARVRVDVDTTVVTDTTVPDGLTVNVPKLTAGIHTVIWSMLFAAASWQTRIELHVNDVPVFRLRKSETGSTFPVNRGFVVMEVVP